MFAQDHIVEMKAALDVAKKAGNSEEVEELTEHLNSLRTEASIDAFQTVVYNLVKKVAEFTKTSEEEAIKVVAALESYVDLSDVYKPVFFRARLQVVDGVPEIFLVGRKLGVGGSEGQRRLRSFKMPLSAWGGLRVSARMKEISGEKLETPPSVPINGQLRVDHRSEEPYFLAMSFAEKSTIKVDWPEGLLTGKCALRASGGKLYAGNVEVKPEDIRFRLKGLPKETIYDGVPFGFLRSDGKFVVLEIRPGHLDFKSNVFGWLNTRIVQKNEFRQSKKAFNGALHSLSGIMQGVRKKAEGSEMTAWISQHSADSETAAKLNEIVNTSSPSRKGD